MKTKNNTAITIGLDLGDRKHSVCVLGAGGEVIKQETITNNRACLTVLSRRHPGALMVMEVGMHSPWISRFLKNLGHRVLVANPRKVPAIYQNVRKSDRNDAELLARIGRADEKLLYPVEHVSEEMQRDLLQIKLRDNLVRQRVDKAMLSGVIVFLSLRMAPKMMAGDPQWWKIAILSLPLGFLGGVGVGSILGAVCRLAWRPVSGNHDRSSNEK